MADDEQIKRAGRKAYFECAALPKERQHEFVLSWLDGLPPEAQEYATMAFFMGKECGGGVGVQVNVDTLAVVQASDQSVVSDVGIAQHKAKGMKKKDDPADNSLKVSAVGQGSQASRLLLEGTKADVQARDGGKVTDVIASKKVRAPLVALVAIILVIVGCTAAWKFYLESDRSAPQLPAPATS